MRRDPLQVRLMGLMAGTIALLVVPAFVGWLHIERTQTDDRIATLGTLVAESLASELAYPISVGDWDAVGDAIELRRRPSEIAFIVADVGGGPRVVRAKEGVEGCAARGGAPCTADLHSVTRPVLSYETDAGLFAEAGATRTSTLGTVQVAIDLAQSNAELTRHTHQMALTILLASLAVFLAAGGLARWIGAAMSQQNDMLAKATARALEASRLKSEFLANMSHEIRTPMNGVLGMASVLAARPLDDEARDIVDTITSSARALLSILNDTLDLSKVEAGMMDLERVSMDPEAVVDDVVELLADPAHAKGIDLLTVIEGPVPSHVLGDPTRVRQIVTNLVSNAIKFTSEGSVSVHLGATDSDLRVEVRDTGIGVSAEAQRYIFDAFRQADGSTTRRFGGTGLGLAIARQMVELMGGRIGVDSVPGRSSTFWFELPLSEPVASPATLSAAGPVLVVSDRDLARRALVRRLETMGVADVRATASAAEARAALGSAPAVVMIDLAHEPAAELIEAVRAAGARPVRVVGRGRTSDVPNVPTLVRPWRAARVHACLTQAHPVARRSIVPEQQRSPRDPSRVPSVLVVDDNLVNLKVATHMLERCGCRVTTCGSGERALELLGGEAFDAVLMDCQMPGLDGYDTTRALRRREAETGRRTPVIAATAHAMHGDRERCLEAGMDDYVSKPLVFEDVRRVIEEWAEARAPTRRAS